MQKKNTHLADEDLRVLRVLTRRFFRPWFTGAALCCGVLKVSVLTGDHIEATRTLKEKIKHLEYAGMLEIRAAAHRGLAWDVRITKNGKRQARDEAKKAYASSLLMAAFLTACAGLGKPSVEPIVVSLPKRPAHSDAGGRMTIQKRASNGAVYWTSCTDDCPVATLKRPAQAEPAIVLKGLEGGAQGTANTKPIGVNQTLELKPSTELASLKYAIFFDYASANLNRTGKAAIEALAPDALRAETIEIVGRADPEGDSRKNEDLARKRGEAVRRALAQNGVDGVKVNVTGKVENAGVARRVMVIGKSPDKPDALSRRSDVNLAVRMLTVKR